jgi:actin related protein 2/3 complex subunit 4
MRQRAEQFSIVRKKAINSDAFDLSFLVTQKHRKQFVNSSLVAFMMDFLKSVDGEISEQKLSVSSRGRAVAEEFLGGFC